MSVVDDKLPHGWVQAKLGELGMDSTRNVDPSKYPNKEFELWSVPSFPSGEPEIQLGEDIGSSKQQVVEGDVLLCKINPRINRVWVVGARRKLEQIASSEWIVFRNGEVDPNFLMHRLREGVFRGRLCADVSGVGGSLTRARPQTVKNLEVTLPPLPEQRRIVAKIEALQERSRKAREALAEVGPLVEQFRQSLLAAAFRGDLTADWRAANPNVEPASELLTRIRQERRQKWEQSELTKFEAKGKQPPKDWQQRYQEPEPTDNLALPNVPVSWCWCALEELATHQSGYAFQSKHFSADGIQVVKLGNLYQGRFDLSRDPAYLPVDHIDAEAVRVLDGDILVSQTGTRYKRDYGFFVLVPPDSEPLLLNQRVLAVRPVRPTLSEWFVYSSRLECYRDYFFSTETGGVNQGNVGVGGIMRGPIPLAPEKEIAEISRRLKEAYASINEIEVSCGASESDLAQLDQSILAKAFRGELVPQDPNDEPASELLAHIRGKRDASEQQKNSKPRKASKKPRKDDTAS